MGHVPETRDQLGATEIAETLMPIPVNTVGSTGTAAESSQFARRYAAHRDRLRFLVSDQSSRCDTYCLSPWMVMAVVDVACTDSFESRLTGQDIVELHFRLSGSLEIAGSWGGLSVNNPSCLLWYQAAGCNDAAERIGGGGKSRETWISLYCDGSWMREIPANPSAFILDWIESASADRAVPQYWVTPRIGPLVPLLKDILRANTADPLHWLYASAKASELLYISLNNINAFRHAATPSVRLTARDRSQLDAVRDILAFELGAPPRLAVLARRVGISASKLCSGFRHQFGETMSDFSRRLRLEMARDLLRTSELQVSQIAGRAGYTHHSTFTAAFARHFGVSPKGVRRAARPH